MTKEQLLRHLGTLDDHITKAAVYLMLYRNDEVRNLDDVATNLQDAQELVEQVKEEIKNG